MVMYLTWKKYLNKNQEKQMIKELQDRLLKLNNNKGQSYPCGNQIVANLIVLKEPNSIEYFERTHPNFVFYRRSKDTRNNEYINSRTKELWRVIILKDNTRGYRAHKAIIDSTIEDELMMTIGTLIFQSLYCCYIEFF